jgi:uncharacterized coiled-coil protein SlyX
MGNIQGGVGYLTESTIWVGAIEKNDEMDVDPKFTALTAKAEELLAGLKETVAQNQRILDRLKAGDASDWPTLARILAERGPLEQIVAAMEENLAMQRKTIADAEAELKRTRALYAGTLAPSSGNA